MAKNEDLTEFKALQAIGRKNLRVGNLPEETIKALEDTKMDARHASLNALMSTHPTR
jgi:ParB-like chromosome segregation protein Spo0J